MASVLAKLQMKKGVRPSATITLLVITVALCVLAYLYYQRITWDKYEYMGYVVKSQSSIPIVKAPGDDMSTGQEITAGTRVAVTGEYEDWYYIHTKNGKDGWIKKTFVVNIVKVQDIVDARFNFKKGN